MSDKGNTGTEKSFVVKIIVIVLLLCAVAGIWAVKNIPGKTEPETTGAGEDIGNPDFALDVTEKLDLTALKSYGLPILIEFGSESCYPCRQMAPIIEALHSELQGKAIVKYVNVGEHPEFAEGYPLSVIPTQLFINADGSPYQPKDPAALDMKLYADTETSSHVFTTHEGTLTKEQLLTVLQEMGMQ